MAIEDYTAPFDAVRAGQLVPWKVPSVESFQQQADRLNVLAEAIEQARVLS